MIRLLMADDHSLVRSGLKQLFALMPDIDVAGEASNGQEALVLLAQAPFDLLLLDLNMPGISGSDLIKQVKAEHPGLPILVLSMHNKPQVATQALKAGADGYLTKDCDPSVLLTAIRKVAVHQHFIDPEIASQMAFSTHVAEPQQALSERELVVLRLLVQGKLVKQIAAQLSISDKTVSTHKVRLMEKLNITGMAQLMRYALEHGLLE
jgi:DNA-binding NarL/FixJ family response regulator